jgi:hypothetical protein
MPILVLILVYLVESLTPDLLDIHFTYYYIMKNVVIYFHFHQPLILAFAKKAPS